MFAFPASGVAHVDRFSQLHTFNLTALYGISQYVAVGLSQPLIFGTHQHFNRSIPAVDGGQSAQTEQSASGLGDLAYTLGGSTLFAVGRVGLPTGRNDLVAGNGDHLEELLKPGSGSWGLGVSAGYFQSLHRFFRLFGSLGYDRFFENDHHFQRPAVFGVNVGGALTGLGKLEVPVRFNYAHSFAGKASGTAIPGTTGDFLFVGPGLRLWATDRMALNGEVLFPIYHSIRGQALIADYTVNLGVSALF